MINLSYYFFILHTFYTKTRAFVNTLKPMINGIIVAITTLYRKEHMNRKIDLNADYLRAVHSLKHKIKSPNDLLQIWAAFGPCIEIYPDIEKIRK